MQSIKVAEHHSSIYKLNANIVAAIVYILPALLAFVPYLGYFVWFIPVFAFMFEKKSRYVRLCCSQAIAISIVRLIFDVIFDSISAIAREIAYFNKTPEFVEFWKINGDPAAGAVTVKLIFAIILTLAALFYAFYAYNWRLVRIPIIGEFCENVADKFRKK
ncbi:MAG: hypothetical protein RRY79_02500 [Clostridia bacterium]